MENIGRYAKKLGGPALVLISAGGRKRLGQAIEDSFAAAGCALLFADFGGECCRREIDRATALARSGQCGLVVGVGGGKVLDTARAAAYDAGTPVMICPTLASTDAPCSSLSVLYSEDGAFETYLFLGRNPDVVLVDSAVIAASPVRMTVAGMGDALATYFEARACAASGGDTCAGGKPNRAALALARLCFDTLMADGLQAKRDLEQKRCTEAVERIIEANTLLSGLGFESGGLAAAHAVHNGLTALKECHAMNHGEKVAFGTLTQLVLENTAPEELERVVAWCAGVGLPVTLEELGLAPIDQTRIAALCAGLGLPAVLGELGADVLMREKLMIAARAACAPADTMGNLPFPVTPEDVCNAMLKADALGRAFLQRQA